MQFDLVLGRYTYIAEVVNFLLFYTLDAGAALLNFLASLFAFLEIIKTVLLGDFLVLLDLRLKSHLVAREGRLMFRCHLALALLVFLLLLNDPNKLAPFHLRLLNTHIFLVAVLLLPLAVQIKPVCLSL